MGSFKKKNSSRKSRASVQGGAVNRGLLFAGPPPSPLGAVSGKISKICQAAA
jgi:hypothetical protein